MSSTDPSADTTAIAADGAADGELSGSGLHAEKGKRLAKIEALRDAGVEAYPYRFDRSATLAELRSAHGDLAAGTETEVHVAVAGRMMLKRDTGKLIFADLRDRSDHIQLFISKAVVGDEAFARIAELDLGSLSVVVEAASGRGAEDIVREALPEWQPERIDAARALLPLMRFYRTRRMMPGLSRLGRHVRRQSLTFGGFAGPLHDVNSHGADAFGEYAVGRPLVAAKG